MEEDDDQLQRRMFLWTVVHHFLQVVGGKGAERPVVDRSAVLVCGPHTVFHCGLFLLMVVRFLELPQVIFLVNLLERLLVGDFSLALIELRQDAGDLAFQLLGVRGQFLFPALIIFPVPVPGKDGESLVPIVHIADGLLGHGNAVQIEFFRGRVDSAERSFLTTYFCIN